VGKAREFAVLLAAIGTIWAGLANRKDLDQRDYTLAETFGRYILSVAEPDEGMWLSSYDAQATTLYLKEVKGEFPRVRVMGVFVDTAPRRPFSGTGWALSELPPSEAELSKQPFVPVGALYRRDIPGLGFVDEAQAWREPVPPEDLVKACRRERGQFVEHRSEEILVRPEPYEKRLLRLVLLIRKNRAGVLAKSGGLAEAERLYESILALDPWTRDDAAFLMSVAVVEVGLKKYARAEELYKSALKGDLPPKKRAEAFYFLAALCGDRPEGAEWKAKALADPSLVPELRMKLEGR